MVISQKVCETPIPSEYGSIVTLTFWPKFFSQIYTCIGALPESLGEKPNVKFFTVDLYFWAMSFVRPSTSAENETYCLIWPPGGTTESNLGSDILTHDTFRTPDLQCEFEIRFRQVYRDHTIDSWSK